MKSSNENTGNLTRVVTVPNNIPVHLIWTVQAAAEDCNSQQLY
jgi:hypothetical protein